MGEQVLLLLAEARLLAEADARNAEAAINRLADNLDKFKRRRTGALAERSGGRAVEFGERESRPRTVATHGEDAKPSDGSVSALAAVRPGRQGGGRGRYAANADGHSERRRQPGTVSPLRRGAAADLAGAEDAGGGAVEDAGRGADTSGSRPVAASELAAAAVWPAPRSSS